MSRIISALGAGLVFGLGIAISGMGNPAKVLNFFDVFGIWDPSLVFVMGGALITTAIGYRIVFRAKFAPMFDTKFHLPTSKTIDAKLVGGSALFGVGWGISGFCPGGAGRFNDAFPAQVAVLGGAAANVYGLVASGDVFGVGISVGINGDGFDGHAAGGGGDAAGDFATVGDEDFFEHGSSSF